MVVLYCGLISGLAGKHDSRCFEAPGVQPDASIRQLVERDLSGFEPPDDFVVVEICPLKPDLDGHS